MVLSHWVPPAVTVLGLLPAIWLVFAAVTDQLGANPAEALVRQTGDMALRMLCVTLAVTPLRQAFGWTFLVRLRRRLGLIMFFYAVMHLLCYASFDMGLDVAEIAKDIAKRPFILVGFLAWVLLVPLAATSFNRAVRALGAVRWQWLHRCVYAVALLAMLHFFWMRAAKNNFADVAVYGAILALLLGWRVASHYTKRSKAI